jgi:hypothetical protein
MDRGSGSERKPMARWTPQRLSKLMADLDKLKQQVSVAEFAKEEIASKWASKVSAVRET